MQKAFVNNFDNAVNHRVDIWEGIKCCQDTLTYASLLKSSKKLTLKGLRGGGGQNDPPLRFFLDNSTTR